jgi:putative peptidoglycan lipid II flippase
MSEEKQSDNLQIARAAGIVMGAFVLSNLVGLARQILVSNTFGTEVELDAFNAAATYPDLIFSLVAGGALASAFVPTLTGFLTRGDRQGGWFLSSSISNLVFLILSGLSLVSAWLSPWIVGTILTPEYSPELQALTTSLLRILLLAPAIFGVSGLIMGILNAHQVFLWPALAPSMLWLGMIIGVLFFAPTMGIFGLAWGYVLGAVLHLAIQIPGLLRLPARQYFAALGLRFKAVREVGRLMGPRLLGVAAVQINFVINTILATGMTVGSLASIKYAWAVMSMPQVVIAQSIAIAALPTFSAQMARGQLAEMRSSLAATLRGVILLSLPATCGLILLRVPITAFLFQRGAFSAESTEMVAWALLWYSVGLFGHGVVEILSRAFYAMHDTKTPVFVGIGAMSLNVLLSLAFAAIFESIGWMPHGGLALANSLATALEMAVLWVLMQRRLKGLNGKSILDGAIKAAGAALVMSLMIWVWLQITSGQPVWLVAAGGVLLGAAVYGVLVFVFRVQEARMLASYVQRRLRTLA